MTARTLSDYFSVAWTVRGALREFANWFLASPRASTLAWWIPYATLIAALLVSAPIRAVVWTVALIWMGTACILMRADVIARIAVLPDLTISR